MHYVFQKNPNIMNSKVIHMIENENHGYFLSTFQKKPHASGTLLLSWHTGSKIHSSLLFSEQSNKFMSGISRSNFRLCYASTILFPRKKQLRLHVKGCPSLPDEDYREDQMYSAFPLWP